VYSQIAGRPAAIVASFAFSVPVQGGSDALESGALRVAALAAQGARADDRPSTPAPIARPGSIHTKESDLVENRHYMNRDGSVAHLPAHSISGDAHTGAHARCVDSSYSFSVHRSGTCSRHRGVTSRIRG
jgi:uncharacterized protein DUF3761